MELKKYNGRGQGLWGKYTLNVAAKSKAQAARLVSQVCYGRKDRVASSEITNYFSDTWGNKMNGIDPEKPCVWITNREGTKDPEKILETEINF